MNKITNRQAICEALMDAAKTDQDIVVLCSDSRGSASLTPFAKEYPEQFIEVGIAEQNLVSVSAGLASCGKKYLPHRRPAFSPQEVMSRQKLMLHIPIQTSL